MSKFVNGTVAKVTSTNKGFKVYFGLIINETADVLYRCGENKPNCEVGDRVTFTFRDTKFGPFVEDGSLKVVTNNSPASSKYGSNSDYQNKEKYWREKEERDIDNSKRYAYRAAHAAAINLVELALSNGALTLGGGKASNKFEVLTAQINKIADEKYIQFQDRCFEVEEMPLPVDGVPAEEADGGDWKE